MLIRFFFINILFLSLAINSKATDPAFEKGMKWSSYRDLTSESFLEKYQRYRNEGLIMIDLDAYPTSSGLRYSMVWEENKTNRDWKLHRNMTSDEYLQKWEELKDKGYRPTDIESYSTGNGQRFDGIWVKNTEGYGWSSKRGLTKAEYETYIREQKDAKRRMVDLEMYVTNSGIRYSAIWVDNRNNIDWKEVHGLNRSDYQQRLDQLMSEDYRVTNFDSYTDGGTQRYAMICEKHAGFAYQVRSDRTELDYANLWREYRDKGYRLVDFECYSTSSGLRYAGVWLENNSRYHYDRQASLDRLMNNYLDSFNIPGISVAIVKDGEMIYRRGFGFADKEKQQVAHGETIYLAASISKVISGTIAVKLQDERHLRDGTAVNLNLNNTTRSYLTNVAQSNGTKVTLPARHTHTLAQLYSHLACIHHYKTGPEPELRQYDLAIDALPQIWNAPFVAGCTVGTTRSYSTHAHAFLAAVLETVTHHRSAELIQSEIARPYHLETMRAQYTEQQIPYDYDRARPYDDNNHPTTYPNSSWKVFGGGIEVSTVDLAWFGWKVLHGEILNATARDKILWTRVNPDEENGIAWEVRSKMNKRIAEHSGSWTGALCRLRVYRDDGLVIAVMSNRDNHSNLSGLTDKIAEVVLK